MNATADFEPPEFRGTIEPGITVAPAETSAYMYDAGSFVKGDRVRLTDQAAAVRHIGATGTVVKVETDGKDAHGDLIFPIVVWLDAWPARTSFDEGMESGLPLCAREVEHVD